MKHLIFCIITILTWGRLAIASVQDVLTPADITLYQKIFSAQQKSDFKTADKLALKLNDRSLMGYVLYERYFSSHYKTQKKEIESWLKTYSDLPIARDIYDLGQQKKAKLDHKPKTLFGGHAKTCSAVFRPEPIDLTRGKSFSYLSADRQKKAKKLMKQINRFLNQGRTLNARQLIESSEAKNLFSYLDHDSARTALAFSYFIDGEDKKALDLATSVLAHSADQIPQAYWVAGLVSWRQKNYAAAAEYFAQCAKHPKVYPLLESGSALWAARSYLKSGQFEKVAPFLKQAAQYQRLFYGIIAMRMLGQDLNHVWDTPPKQTDDVIGDFSHPALNRFYALQQIGQDEWAKKELLKLYLEADSDARGILFFISEQNGFSDELVGLVGDLGNSGTRYPAPNWTPLDGWKVDKALVYAFVRQESCFNQRAESSVGAIGLMQLMPSTARELAQKLQVPFKKQLLKDPTYNLSLGQNYLLKLMKISDIQNNLMYLAVAYNAGPGNLIKWKRKMACDDPLLFIESIPSRETRSFVERIIVNYWIYRVLMGQELASLDMTATGDWPCYHQQECQK